MSGRLPDLRSSERLDRMVRTFAILTALALFPLIIVGAGVTSNDAGMAFPDWPTADGHILNPPGWLQDGKKLWEHSHRVLGATVGLLAIGLCVTSWRRGGVMKALGLAALLAIIAQGLLGGQRVLAASKPLAIVHGVWAQVCFSLVWMLVLLSSQGWRTLGPPQPARAVGFYRRLCATGTLCIFLQLCFGAIYRHLQSPHALIAHLLGAVVVIVLLGWIAMWTLEQFSNHPLLLRIGRWLGTLLGAQMLIGGLTLLVVVMNSGNQTNLKWAAPAAHVLVGAMLLACMGALTILSYRVLTLGVNEGHPASKRSMVTS